jgi:hypothetical protein
MIHVVQPTLAQAQRVLHAALIFSPARRPLWGGRPLAADPMNDPTLLDDQFDELECDMAVLLRIAIQP